MISSMDFYNVGIAAWEPLLERWKADAELKTSNEGFQLNISSEYTMQITVSGVMLATLLQTYSLLLRLEDSSKRDEAPDVMIRNQLGVPLEIYDSRSNTKLVTLLDDTLTPLRRTQLAEVGTGSGHVRLQQTPMLLDIKFLEKLGEQRRSLYHLPLYIKNPRAYHLKPISSDNNDSKVTAETVAIVEEIFENQRYDLLTLDWTQPYLFTDPSEWSTANCMSIDINEIKLPNENWEWQTDWAVDLNGVGVEIDEEGWEYALDFSYFTSSSQRHTHQPLDCVRRRRWCRIRVPKPAPLDDPTRPLTVFWDVSTKASGSKSVLIRSPVQIANYLPFSIVIALSNSAWQWDSIFGPIDENKKFGIPLLYAYATGLRIKPGNSLYEWCVKLSCGMKSHDFKTTFDVSCQGLDLPTIHMRVLFKQVNRSLLITVVPYVIVTNRLPCKAIFRCHNEDSSQVEEGSLDPGCSTKLVHINQEYDPFISFRIDLYHWSSSKLIMAALQRRIDVDVLDAEGEVGLVLSLRSKLGQAQTAEVFVFSTGAFIDRSGLSLCVRCPTVGGAFLTRTTYDLDDCISDEKCNGKAYDDEESISNESTSIRIGLTGIPLGIDRFIVRSKRKYLITTADVGDLVYTDRDLRWTQLPMQMRGQIYVCTPCADSAVQRNPFIEFIVNRPAVIYVLYDLKTSLLPKWLVSSGFKRISHQAVARRVASGQVFEHHYVAWGKYVTTTDLISLGSNASKDCRSMYVVFAVGTAGPRHTEELLDQVRCFIIIYLFIKKYIK